MSDLELSEEEHDSDQVPDFDDYTSEERETRSRFFFAIMCFFIALLFLIIYLNNHLDFVPSLMLLSGIIAFGFVGLLFLQGKSVLNRTVNSWLDSKDDGLEEASFREGEDTDEEDDDDVQSLFEVLVKEALSSIPEEFREKMENVLVRVEIEPGEEVLQRVGIKEGYTLLGLYEGVPLTAYGRLGTPEIITIYERTIEWYCGGDPDRIREQVRHTVLHEVAHHFGIDHEEMPIWVR